MAGFGTWPFGTKGKRAGGSPSLPPASFAEGNNDFALAMYRQLRQRAANLFFSPFSIRTALGMTLAGARSQTAAQMREALRISSFDRTPHAAFSEIIQRLNAASGGQYEMSVANSLWCQDGAPLQPEFLDLIASYYAGEISAANFGRGVEAARVRINRWVEHKTRHKIQGLVPSGGLDAETRLLLVNAVYFKGRWELEFRRTGTEDQPFWVEQGATVLVPLMVQGGVVRYIQGSGYQAVDLVYRGDDLSMLVLLPDRKDGLGNLEKRVSTRMLNDCVRQMESQLVVLYLPRFKLSWTGSLFGQLTALGMTLAFTRGQADFSGIDGREPPNEESLFLSAVLHKALVETNEEGTEAAAATATIAAPTAAARRPKPPPIPIFRADHPFLFAIRDRKSGAILFLGRMADPTRET